MTEPPYMDTDHQGMFYAEQNKCDGIRISRPWKFYPCGAVAKYELDGLRYCGAHYAKTVKAKEQRDSQTPSKTGG